MCSRLRELRIDSDKTQQDIADVLHISRPAYSLYERGQREMSYEHLCILADYFGVSLDYLFGRTDLPSFPADVTPADYQLLQKYKALDPRGRRTVRALLEYEAHLQDTLQKEKD